VQRADRLLNLTRGAGVARVAATLLGLAGCAEVLAIPEDPELSSGAWRCLGETSALSLLPAPVASRAVVRVQACDFARGCSTKVTGLRARVCQKKALGCGEPVALDLVDSEGLFTFEVPTPAGGFDGYLDVSSATELCTNPSFGDNGPTLCALSPGCDTALPDDRCRIPLYAHALLFFNPPITTDSAEPLTLPLIPSTALPSWARAAGAELDPTRGNLLVSATDCEGAPAAGVTYRVAPDPEQAVELYVREGEPSDALETDDSGVGALLGVPEGYAAVAAYNADDVQLGALAVQAAPLTVTYAALAPSAGAAP
jgi:hypothetical protein